MEETNAYCLVKEAILKKLPMLLLHIPDILEKYRHVKKISCFGGGGGE